MVATVQPCTLVALAAARVDVVCTTAPGSPQSSVAGRAAPSVEDGATRIQDPRTTVGVDGELPRKTLTVTSRLRRCASPDGASTCRSRSPCSSPGASHPPSWPASPTAQRLVAAVA